MNRLVITGLACPLEPWAQLLGNRPGQRILPIYEVFRHSSSCDPREMSRYVTREMERQEPDSLICHDLGVPLALLSLLRLNRKGKCRNTRVTLFNGAFRKVNLFKANHPFKVQLMSHHRAIRMIENLGGIVDLRLKDYMPRIRAMYRLVILYGMTEKIGSWIGLDDLVGFGDRSKLAAPVQIIASKNDPFIPFDSIVQLKSDINPARFVELDYGHFPYTIDRNQVVPLIEKFEHDYPVLGPINDRLNAPPPSRLLW